MTRLPADCTPRRPRDPGPDRAPGRATDRGPRFSIGINSGPALVGNARNGRRVDRRPFRL